LKAERGRGRQGDVSLVSFSLAAELAIGTDPLSPLRLRFAADKRSVPKATVSLELRRPIEASTLQPRDSAASPHSSLLPPHEETGGRFTCLLFVGWLGRWKAESGKQKVESGKGPEAGGLGREKNGRAIGSVRAQVYKWFRT